MNNHFYEELLLEIWRRGGIVEKPYSSNCRTGRNFFQEYEKKSKFSKRKTETYWDTRVRAQVAVLVKKGYLEQFGNRDRGVWRLTQEGRSRAEYLRSRAE